MRAVRPSRERAILPWKSVKDFFRILASLFVVILLCAVVAIWVENWGRFPVGTRCILSRSVYGMADLNESYEDLEKARIAKDDIGLAELAESGRAILLPQGTHGLVIETRLKAASYTLYRRLRIFNEPYTGKALWVRKDALAEAASAK